MTAAPEPRNGAERIITKAANEMVTEGPHRGRPRDTEVDRRITDAARQIYNDRGWSGFNFDVVAKTAGVSKDAIYRRYDSRLQLLITSLKTSDPSWDFPPGTDLRTQLIVLARENLARWMRPQGMLVFRIFVESASNPELLEAYHQQVAFSHVKHFRAIIRQAIDDGRLSSIQNSTAFIDSLLGGLLMHVLATPSEFRTEMREKSDQFIADHVDLLLAGAGYTGH